MAIGGSIGSHDQGLHEVHSVLVAADEDGVGVFVGEGGGDVGEFLGKPDHFVVVGSVVGDEVRGVVMLDLGGGLLHVDVVEAQVLQEFSVLLVEGEGKEGGELVFVLFETVPLLNSFLDQVVGLDDVVGELLGQFVLLGEVLVEAGNEYFGNVVEALQQGLNGLGLRRLVVDWEGQ